MGEGVERHVEEKDAPGTPNATLAGMLSRLVA